MTFLEQIVKHKRKEIEKKKIAVPVRSFTGERVIEFRDFKKSIKKGGISLIAEIKRRAPSQGNIIVNFSPVRLAKIYESGGADAISVLTDHRYFGGREQYITQVKETCALPVLRKEFIIDEYQIYESHYLGADAILLIVSILEQNQLKKFIRIARRLNLAVLVETHNKNEIERALDADAEIIGINNRNLKNFRINLETSLHLCQSIPESVIRVSESGIKSFADIRRLKEAGFDAVLVGTSILQAKDIADKIAELKNLEGE